MPLFGRKPKNDASSTTQPSGPGAAHEDPQTSVGNAGLLDRLFGRDASGQQNAEDGEETPVNGPQPEWKPAPTLDQVRAGAVMELGHEGAAVADVQRMLTGLGFPVQATGKIGPTTVGVIQKFQTTYLVESTGKIGPTTLAALEKAKAASVTIDELIEVFPNLPADQAKQYLPFLNAAMYENDINNKARKAAFIAQVGHESLGLTAFEEFASGAQYEGRRDLGNTQRGDGKRYKGRGPIQLTGRANYKRIGGELGLDLENNPERAADVDVGFRTAGYFWKDKGLNELADDGKFDTITSRINGGQNGRADRRNRWATAKTVIASADTRHYA